MGGVVVDGDLAIVTLFSCKDFSLLPYECVLSAVVGDGYRNSIGKSTVSQTWSFLFSSTLFYSFDLLLNPFFVFGLWVIMKSQRLEEIIQIVCPFSSFF